MKDIVSIIVPVYNVPRELLKDCLEHLKNLKYKNTEIIIVDDGSTDDSGDFCNQYKKYDFKVYHKKNGGLCDARNYGVSKATGEWITFVDGDDYLEEDVLNRVLKKMKNKNVDIVFFGTIKQYKNSSFKYDYNGYFEDGIIYEDKLEMLKKLLDFNSGVGDAHSKLYNRKFLVENDLFHKKEIKQGIESIDFNFRCYEKANKILFINEYGYHYVFNDKSITFSMNENAMNSLLKGIDCLYDDLKESEYKDSLKDTMDKRMQYVVATTLISGIFSPNNKLNKKEKKYYIDKMLSNKHITEALSNKKVEIEVKRKIILFMLKNKIYFGLSLLSYLRMKQKQK